MPRILVVEDSEVDRTLIRSLLEHQDEIESPEVVVVEDGARALEEVRATPPDLVITDLVMPEMGGLELVERMAEHHPLIPVIVTTARGSEQTAVEALSKGAASYVPKSALGSQLIEAVESVLAAAARRRGRARLMRVMVESKSSFVLENDRMLFRSLLQFLQDTMSEFGLFDEVESMRVCVAIEEALNNAAEHGNLELDSEMRERDFAGYIREMQERGRRAPYRDRRIHFHAYFSAERSQFDIRDEGRGFDHRNYLGAVDPSRLTAASGRGLTLMQAFLDEVAFNEVGNAVRLTKYASPAAATPS